MNLAIKDIRAGLFRFTLTCVGIGLMLMTSLAMTGLYQGIVADALSIIDHAHADLWVVEAGTEGPFAEGSLIDRSVLSRSLALQDVATARQFTLQSERFTVRGKTVRASLVGLDYPTDTGSTIPLSAGRHLRAGRNEAIADQSTGLHTGDTLRLGTTDLTVVGVAKTTWTITVTQWLRCRLMMRSIFRLTARKKVCISRVIPGASRYPVKQPILPPYC
ncbi:ABC transporter permease [Mangrovibacter sp. SLW1]